MYRDQFGEFAHVYWGLKVKKCVRLALNFMSLIPSPSVCQMLANFLQWNSKVQGKKKKVL